MVSPAPDTFCPIMGHPFSGHFKSGWRLSYRIGHFCSTFFGFVNRSISNSFWRRRRGNITGIGRLLLSPQRHSWGLRPGVQDTFCKVMPWATTVITPTWVCTKVLGRRGNLSLNYGLGGFNTSGNAGALQSNCSIERYRQHSVRLSIGFSPYTGYPDGSTAIDSTP